MILPGGQIQELGRVGRARRHRNILRALRLRDRTRDEIMFGKVDQITNLIPTPPPHNLSVELLSRSDDATRCCRFNLLSFLASFSRSRHSALNAIIRFEHQRDTLGIGRRTGDKMEHSNIEKAAQLA